VHAARTFRYDPPLCEAPLNWAGGGVKGGGVKLNYFKVTTNVDLKSPLYMYKLILQKLEPELKR
jgi:hypothetical protein